ncbi:MAG TPA: hypothetical protein VK698_16690 [Kofleriaceae bacterium]|nr:hypothetical protein [Kofleriaceae bacterium]
MGEPAIAPPIWRRFGLQLRKRWRAWLRAIHRDVGYAAVGLTFVYAMSGIAINHIGQWDPNFKSVVTHHQLRGKLPADEKVAVKQVLAELEVPEAPRDGYYETDGTLQIFTDDRTLVVDPRTLDATEKAEKPRFFLRLANWLHYNRGKSAWTFIADGYAVFLLFLATSGVFMLKGRKGFIGRGAVLIALGASVPLLYVHFSGGP